MVAYFTNHRGARIHDTLRTVGWVKTGYVDMRQEATRAALAGPAGLKSWTEVWMRDPHPL